MFEKQDEIVFLNVPSIEKSSFRKWKVKSQIRVNTQTGDIGFIYYETQSNIELSMNFENSINIEPYLPQVHVVNDCVRFDDTICSDLDFLQLGKTYNIFSYLKKEGDENYMKSKTFSFSTPDSLLKIKTYLKATNRIRFDVQLSPSFLKEDEQLHPKLFIDSIEYGVQEIFHKEGEYFYEFFSNENFVESKKESFIFEIPIHESLSIRDSLLVNPGTRIRLDSFSIENNQLGLYIDPGFFSLKTPCWDSLYYIKDSLFELSNVDFSCNEPIKVPDEDEKANKILIIPEGINFNCNYKYVLWGKRGKINWLTNVVDYKFRAIIPEITNFKVIDSTATRVLLGWDLKTNGEDVKGINLIINDSIIGVENMCNAYWASNLKPYSKNCFTLLARNSVGENSKTICGYTSDTIPPLRLNISSLIFPIKAEFNLEIEGIDKEEMGDKLEGIYMYTSNNGQKAVDSIVSNIAYREESTNYNLSFYPILEKRPFDVFVKVRNKNGNERKSNIITISE